MHNKQELNQLIARLYETFSGYPGWNGMAHCSHCVDQKDIKKLLQSPLEKLTFEELEKYFWKAITTWGDVDDFKHFLPRLLELAANAEDNFMDVWLIGTKLRYGNFENWSSAEQEAVTCFFESLWSRHLSGMADDFDINCGGKDNTDNYLQCFSYAYPDIQRFLDIWHNQTSISALRRLVHFVISHIEPLTGKKRLWDNYDVPAGQQQVIAFLLDEKTRHKLESAFFKYADSPFAAEFSEGIKKLEWIRSVFNQPQ